MHFLDNVFAVVCGIVGIFYVYCQNDYEKDDADTENDEERLRDNYLFVALIDIVFTDGSKRTCTGTIIHDNVVITAAHCFISDDSVQPELTASFVVIGTKKMFETSYEQYLPIERIITHPKYRGWTADLALVFTFAGMMSDKPGRVVRLASEKTSTDSEVTVFSWGQCKDDDGAEIHKSTTESPCSDDEIFKLREKQNVRNSRVTSMIAEDVSNLERKLTRNQNKNLEGYNKKNNQRIKKRKHRLKQRKPQVTVARASETKKMHTVLTSIEKQNRFQIKQRLPEKSDSSNQMSSELSKENVHYIDQKSAVVEKRKRRRQNYKILSYYRNNWRRNIGDQKNKLTVEVFAVVNTQTCKKLVEKAMPSEYKMKNPNEFLCYTSEEHYITKEDSGAPAMRLGHLVAVTAGGVDYDGERVAVGIKIVCFCSWIAENLPKSGTRIQCCKNCCEENYKKQNEGSFKHTHRKKKRRIT